MEKHAAGALVPGVAGLARFLEVAPEVAVAWLTGLVDTRRMEAMRAHDPEGREAVEACCRALEKAKPPFDRQGFVARVLDVAGAELDAVSLPGLTEALFDPRGSVYQLVQRYRLRGSAKGADGFRQAVQARVLVELEPGGKAVSKIARQAFREAFENALRSVEFGLPPLWGEAPRFTPLVDLVRLIEAVRAGEPIGTSDFIDKCVGMTRAETIRAWVRAQVCGPGQRWGARLWVEKTARRLGQVNRKWKARAEYQAEQVLGRNEAELVMRLQEAIDDEPEDIDPARPWTNGGAVHELVGQVIGEVLSARMTRWLKENPDTRKKPPAERKGRGPMERSEGLELVSPAYFAVCLTKPQLGQALGYSTARLRKTKVADLVEELCHRLDGDEDAQRALYAAHARALASHEREVEQMLGISGPERRRWTEEGRLAASYEQNVRSHGRTRTQVWYDTWQLRGVTSEQIAGWRAEHKRTLAARRAAGRAEQGTKGGG